MFYFAMDTHKCMLRNLNMNDNTTENVTDIREVEE